MLDNYDTLTLGVPCRWPMTTSGMGVRGGDGVDVIYDREARCIEAAEAARFWTRLMAFYVEEDQGHLMEKRMIQHTFRKAQRGNVFSHLMPWESIINKLLSTCGRVGKL